jgi:hypothetical protein
MSHFVCLRCQTIVLMSSTHDLICPQCGDQCLEDADEFDAAIAAKLRRDPDFAEVLDVLLLHPLGRDGPLRRQS